MIGNEFKAIVRGYHRMAVPYWVRVTMHEKEWQFVMEVVSCETPDLLRPSEPYIEWWRSKISYDQCCRIFGMHFLKDKMYSCRFVFDFNGNEVKPNPFEV